MPTLSDPVKGSAGSAGYAVGISYPAADIVQGAATGIAGVKGYTPSRPSITTTAKGSAAERGKTVNVVAISRAAKGSCASRGVTVPSATIKAPATGQGGESGLGAVGPVHIPATTHGRTGTTGDGVSRVAIADPFTGSTAERGKAGAKVSSPLAATGRAGEAGAITVGPVRIPDTAKGRTGTAADGVALVHIPDPAKGSAAERGHAPMLATIEATATARAGSAGQAGETLVPVPTQIVYIYWQPQDPVIYWSQ